MKIIVEKPQMQRSNCYGEPSPPANASTTQLLCIMLRDHLKRGIGKIIRPRGPESSTLIFHMQNIIWKILMTWKSQKHFIIIYAILTSFFKLHLCIACNTIVLIFRQGSQDAHGSSALGFSTSTQAPLILKLFPRFRHSSYWNLWKQS